MLPCEGHAASCSKLCQGSLRHESHLNALYLSGWGEDRRCFKSTGRYSPAGCPRSCPCPSRTSCPTAYFTHCWFWSRLRFFLVPQRCRIPLTGFPPPPSPLQSLGHRNAQQHPSTHVTDQVKRGAVIVVREGRAQSEMEEATLRQPLAFPVK